MRPETLIQIIRDHPEITTPELAEFLGVSVIKARWYVHQCDDHLEFYDGNHIRIKEQSHDAK